MPSCTYIHIYIHTNACITEPDESWLRDANASEVTSSNNESESGGASPWRTSSSTVQFDTPPQSVQTDSKDEEAGLLGRVLDANRDGGSDAADDAWFDYLNRDYVDKDDVTRVGDPGSSSVTLSSDDENQQGEQKTVAEKGSRDDSSEGTDSSVTGADRDRPS